MDIACSTNLVVLTFSYEKKDIVKAMHFIEHIQNRSTMMMELCEIHKRNIRNTMTSIASNTTFLISIRIFFKFKKRDSKAQVINFGHYDTIHMLSPSSVMTMS
jgi:hypothetical protein